MIKADEIEAASDKKRVMSLSGGQNRWGEETWAQTDCVRGAGNRIQNPGHSERETRKTELKHSEMWQLQGEIVN